MELDPEVTEALKKPAKITDSLETVVSERALEPRSKPDSLLNARQVAERLGVSRDWVYEHATELGAIRIGRGPRPRLRFPPDLGISVQENKPRHTTASVRATAERAD
jgi:predicted DNA-binding transcriptional regulator AlpA